jgi:Homeodomain-like domain
MARGRKSSLRIVLSSEERQVLERWQRSTTLAAGLVRRGRIILLLAAGASQSAVAQAVGVQRTVVRHWAKRFLAQRLAGLSDAPGRGAKGGFSPRGRDPRRALGLRAAGSGGS